MADAFTLNNFSGSAPRLAPHLIRPGHAALALDCNLHSGNLSSWREPRLWHEAQDKQTSFQFECCWFDYDECVDWAEGPVACRRLFLTGHRPWPSVVDVTYNDVTGECVTEEYRLGVPCPTKAPSAVKTSNGVAKGKDAEGRSYAYHFTDLHGNRGALSPASVAASMADGNSVLVSGWQVPDSSWGVTEVWIYRTVSGHESGRQMGNTDDTTWMLVDKVPVGNTSYLDTKLNELLISALEDDIVEPPPEDLQGIVWIESMNCLAGFVGNRVYFSQNNEYHNWPFYMDLDDNVQALAESNGDIYVATQGRPYIIKGVTDCENAGCRSAIRLPGRFPMAAYGNRHMAAIRAGAVYPSHKGLVLLSGNTAPTILTWPLYDEGDWQRMQPHTCVPVEHGGKLFVFMGNGAFAMATPSPAEQGWTNDAHTDLSDRGVRAAFETKQGDLFLLKEDGLHQWNAGTTLRPHRWRSHELRTSVPIGFGAGRLEFRGAEEAITVQVDDKTALSRPVPSARVFRLPTWANGSRWAVTLEGTSDVSLMSLAPSMHDLGA